MDPPSPDLPAVDSTAKLLQDLHLLERKSRNRHGKHMDTMEMDLALEVPGIPDRLAETSCPVEDLGEEAAGQAYHRSCSNLSLRGEGASSSNALNNESLFRKARLASLISKPHDVRLYHVGKKSPLGIFRPTKWGDRRKLNLDLHAENEASSYDCLNSVESSPSGSIKRTNYGFADSLELSGGAREKETNEIVVAGVGSEHCSTNWVSECNCNENRLSSSSVSQAISEKVALKPYSGRFGRRRLVHYGLISPSNIKGTFSSVNGEPSSPYVERTTVDKGKGIDLSNNSQNKSEHTVFQQHQFDVPRKNSGKRRMEWKVCIPSSNIAKDSKLTDWKREGIHKLDFHEVRDDFSSRQLHVFSPDSEPRRADEKKEQVFLNDDLRAKGPNAKSSVMSSRELLLPGKERTIGAELVADIWPAGNISSRTTHTCTAKGAQLSSHEPSVVSNRKDDQHEKTIVEGINMNMIHPHHGTCSLEAAGPSSCPNETNMSQAQGSTEISFDLNSEDGGQCGAEGLTRGKRKSSSCHTLLGECSRSATTEKEVSHPHSPVQPSRGCSSWCHGVRLGPVIDCDELPSPVLRDTSDHGGNCISSEESVARALQVESDEIMARQLQEQFFNESSDFGGAEEIDATIAWTLQKEEDAQHASFTRNHGRSFPRSPSIAHLYRQYPRESSQNSSGRSTSHARLTSSGRMSQLRRHVRREEDLEARLNFLEAFELAFNNGNDLRSDILHVHRNFNEDDYEMLLALDDDNHQHMGASDHQINSLPQTVIQADNAEEACAICLEHPSVGDTIRHLPCLHKFHKDCIDTWLRRRTSCPICKSTIT